MIFTGLIAENSKKPGWHESRFEEAVGKIRFDCLSCARPMWLPPSKAGKYKTCSSSCRDAAKASLVAMRIRVCASCGSEFTPRKYQLDHGGGLYCSVACSSPQVVKLAHSSEARKKAASTRMRSIQLGLIQALTGPANPQWKGGKDEAIRRRYSSGAASASTRKYRRANPDKVESFVARRAGRIIGRLPRGTTKRVGDLQRWFCAICAEDLEWTGFHRDHIMPLALGGKHEADNIQLLCPPCNTRKSSTHPVDYMQKIGKLL